MSSSFFHPPVFNVFSLNIQLLASKGRVIQIPGGIYINLCTIAVLVGGTVSDSSCELHEY
jgi:hypothetical protein